MGSATTTELQQEGQVFTDIMGRDTTRNSLAYTPELAEEILTRLMNGESLLQICRDERLPSRSTVHLWAINDIDGWYSKYEKARKDQADIYAERQVVSAEDGIEAVKALEDPRQGSGVATMHRELGTSLRWSASRMHPNRWGDTSHVDVSALVAVLSPEEVVKGRAAGLGVTQAKIAEKSGEKPVKDVPDSRAGRGKLS